MTFFTKKHPQTGNHKRSLNQAAENELVQIKSLDDLPVAERQHLQAYGILAGRTVRVLAQKPVTIVQIEQTELAFENEIARMIQIYQN